MNGSSPAQRAVAELLGAAFLLAAVVGSGIMAERLADAVGLALLCNTIATGAILAVLILALGPVSGAHFNPAVTLAFLLRREIGAAMAAVFVLSQVGGGLLGTWIAHVMFDERVLMLGSTARTGGGQWLGELVATFGLVFTILACVRHHADAVPWAVGLYITSAYWFTSSTSFANPTVTIARSLSDSFAGTRPGDAPAFVAMQLAGAVLAVALAGWLFTPAEAEHCSAQKEVA